MALITRVARLFRADFHAVLDRIEEPDVLLKQAVREMQDSVDQDEQRIKLLTHERDQLVVRQADLEQSIAKIEEELDICFVADKEDLARTLIKRKLEAQQHHKLLQRKTETLQESVTELGSRIQENRSHLHAMQQKVELLAQDKSSSHDETPWATVQPAVSDDDVEVAFLREKQKRGTS